MSDASFEIMPASGPAGMAAVAALFADYAAWLGKDLSAQGFEQELASLPGAYAPPGGVLLMAQRGADALGCIALKPLVPPHVAEIKRLYVRPQGRGLGIGKALIAAVTEAGARLGYDELKLDTLPRLAAAIALYTAAGFAPIAPYGSHPYPGLVCLGKRLPGRAP